MKRQSLIAIGIALVLGLVAVYLANTYLTAGRVAQAPEGTTKVAVAAVPLDYGAELTPEKVRFIDYPANALPAGSYRTVNELLPVGKSRVVLRPLAVNEPILADKVTGEGQAASIAALLPNGKRAAAVRINDVSGVAGFIRPNDSVDVLITRQVIGPDNRGNAQVTDVLLQNIRVIAMDQNAKNENGEPAVAQTATLEVEPLDAQKLALAQTVGQISLVLRKPGAKEDNAMVETVSLEDLRYGRYGSAGYARPLAPQALNVQASAPRYTRVAAPRPVRRAAPRPAAPKPVTNSVEVVRGTTGTSYEVGGYGK
ncbi:Flp pilus assembly protein CpaB [Sphingomonas arenae]|uniref:Flp pilus assembly protein CpaB n=1 Tax=Sphingomonas arenae TaxID=2812555 RepID=UPI001968862E|nr:Flp pilus assembly protein CpaB [Sphingomonas arenae]